MYTLNKNKKMNACQVHVLPATSERQQMLVDQKVKFTELLPCTFAVYDYRQVEDVSSVENVHMVTEILSQVFIM